ncbi:Hypothetical predicted protein [Octopus vulgaris]|uniref:Uncharacterized protein n=1 Tax=Octopus vulgaris TaxID=6645 RepID=A0AA36BNJ8_OCTVU|nr:Hypothetical predicted protein [Octopus vulgaris]
MSETKLRFALSSLTLPTCGELTNVISTVWYSQKMRKEKNMKARRCEFDVHNVACYAAPRPCITKSTSLPEKWTPYCYNQKRTHHYTRQTDEKNIKETISNSE